MSFKQEKCTEDTMHDENTDSSGRNNAVTEETSAVDQTPAESDESVGIGQLRNSATEEQSSTAQHDPVTSAVTTGDDASAGEEKFLPNLSSSNRKRAVRFSKEADKVQTFEMYRTGRYQHATPTQDDWAAVRDLANPQAEFGLGLRTPRADGGLDPVEMREAVIKDVDRRRSSRLLAKAEQATQANVDQEAGEPGSGSPVKRRSSKRSKQ